MASEPEKSPVRAEVRPPQTLQIAAVHPSEPRTVIPARDWPHAPPHRLGDNAVYFVTAATLYKAHLFNSPAKLDLLENLLLDFSQQYGWHPEAWAVLVNHYHLVVRGGPDSRPLGDYIHAVHGVSARELNRLDGCSARRVWHNFWDTKLTHQHSYLARLNYVHQNPVKHGLVAVANQYRWGSAAWFERVASPAQVKTIYGFKTDKVQVMDDY